MAKKYTDPVTMVLKNRFINLKQNHALALSTLAGEILQAIEQATDPAERVMLGDMYIDVVAESTDQNEEARILIQKPSFPALHIVS